MSKEFSVFVNIGGKLNPSLAAAVGAAKAQVNGLASSLAGIGARINAPFVAAQKHIAATAKTLENVQRKGRNLTMGVTAPTGLFAVNVIRNAVERDTAGNQLEALGGVSHAERGEIEGYADTIAAKYGNATGILKTFNEMLKAGFDVKAAKGSIASILEGSIVAGDMTGADLAGAVSKVVTQYGLNMKTVEDANASSRRIVDNLVFGANSTSASMQHMVDAYKFVGSAASAAGESIESTNALIIALSKAGQLGSEAGVALRSAYVRLLKPTKEGRATMARLGLDYGSYVSGGTRTGAGISAGLSASGFDMSGSEKALDAALAQNDGNSEGQRKAIYDAVVAKFGAEAAKDRESVLKAVDDAFSMAGSKVDLTKLLIDLKKKDATQGDLARVFEGRQSVRMLSLLKADLEGILKDINEKAPGYGGKTFDIANQGLSKAVRELGAAWQTFSNTLVKAVLPEITTVFSSITDWMKSLAQANPALLRLGIGLTAAAVAAGPLLFVLGAVGRIGLLAMKGISGALMLMLAPIGLVAKGISALAVGIVASLARVRLAMAGLMVLTAVGGAGAGLAALGGAILAFGRAVLLFPLVALRAISVAMLGLVMNPVGVVITALVVALAALGAWVYNNWAGIKEFFAGFGEGFMNGLGPAGDTLKSMVHYLRASAETLSNMLGPLDETGAKWREWGTTLGGVVASGVNLVISGISRLIGFLGTVVSTATAAGSAIKGMFSSGGAAPAKTVPLAGARALGGPVAGGKPYLVGERGPELFVPGATGRIETHGALRRMTENGTAAVAGSTTSNSPRSYNIQNHWAINGADDPRAVASQIDARFAELMRGLENEQRGLLSD